MKADKCYIKFPLNCTLATDQVRFEFKQLFTDTQEWLMALWLIEKMTENRTSDWCTSDWIIRDINIPSA